MTAQELLDAATDTDFRKPGFMRQLRAAAPANCARSATRSSAQTSTIARQLARGGLADQLPDLLGEIAARRARVLPEPREMRRITAALVPGRRRARCAV